MTRHPHTRLGTFLLLCVLCLPAHAAKRICVLADTHVMAPSLVDRSDNQAWQADLAGNKKMQELSVPIFDVLVERIKSDKPDALLIVGDLTKDGEVESHDYVIKKLTEIESVGIPVYVIPGNHDRGWTGGARKYTNNTYTDTKYLSETKFRTYYQDFGYGDTSECHASTLTYATRLFDGLTLIGIDSEQDARIEQDAIEWSCRKAQEARDRGDQVVVMMHHSLIPHFYGQETFHEQSVVDDCDDIRDRLMGVGVMVVLTGHYHVSDIARYTNADGQTIYDISTGSPISHPCDYRTLVFDDTFTKLNILTNTISSLDGYDDFAVYSEQRLRKAIQKWAVNWLSQRSENKLLVELMSQAVTNVFVIHANGNEPANPASSEAVRIYDDIEYLAPLFSLSVTDIMKEVSLSMKSILGDYQDPADITNVVDDRELTITLPPVPTAISSIQRQPGPSDEAWYTLQGLRLPHRPTRPGTYIHQGRFVIL